MLSRRFHLSGLFAVLLALMALLGAGASVPQIDPITGTVILCHDDGGSGGTPSKAPDRPFDCPVCPLCIAMHVPAAPLVSTAAFMAPPMVVVVLKTELPPPSTAPPAAYRPPSQPRAPPIFS
jgi:hypothetical protein